MTAPLVRVALVASAVVLPAPVGAQTMDAVTHARTLYREGVAAANTGDAETYFARFDSVVRLRPGYPGGLYHLSRAAALSGRRGRALAALEAFAATGVSYGVADDSAFASLSGDRRMTAVVAHLEANGAPVERSDEAFTLPAAPLLVEGIAYDSLSGSFFLSTVHGRSILRRDRDGTVSDFVPSAAGGMWGILGLAVDVGRRRLWATTAAMAEVAGLDSTERGRTGVVVYDLDRGTRLARLLLETDGEQVLGDIALTSDGTAYLSDGLAGGLYRARVGDAALTVVLPPGTFGSPQGIVPAGDGASLYVADYSRGVFRVDPVAGTVRQLLAESPQTLLGLDGMVAAPGGLAAIQNGIAPARVIRLTLDASGDAIASVTVLESNHSRYQEPTQAVTVGDTLFYVANSQWPLYRDGREPETGEVQGAVVLALPLGGGSGGPRGR